MTRVGRESSGGVRWAEEHERVAKEANAAKILAEAAAAKLKRKYLARVEELEQSLNEKVAELFSAFAEKEPPSPRRMTRSSCERAER